MSVGVGDLGRRSSAGSFKARHGNNSATGYAPLRKQTISEKPHGDACLAFRSWSAYSFRSISSCAVFERAGQVPFGGQIAVTSDQ